MGTRETPKKDLLEKSGGTGRQFAATHFSKKAAPSDRLMFTSDDYFPHGVDGLNKSIMTAVSKLPRELMMIASQCPHPWKGNDILRRGFVVGEDIYGRNVTLADFRTAVEFLRHCNEDAAGDPGSWPLDAYKPIKGVRVMHNHGLNHVLEEPIEKNFVLVDVAPDHPIRGHMGQTIGVTPAVAELISMPLRLCPYAVTKASDTGTNPAVTYLMVNCNIADESFGFASVEFLLDLGDFLIIKADLTDLTPEEVFAMHYLVEKKMMNMKIDSREKLWDDIDIMEKELKSLKLGATENKGDEGEEGDNGDGGSDGSGEDSSAESEDEDSCPTALGKTLKQVMAMKSRQPVRELLTMENYLKVFEEVGLDKPAALLGKSGPAA